MNLKKLLLLSVPFIVVLLSFSYAEDVKICTMDYSPVCGIDWITYSNLCMAWDTAIIYEWECLSVDNQDTWENIIPMMCESYFDWCNQCFSVDGKLWWCTMMYCETTDKPYCTKRKWVEEWEIPYYLDLKLSNDVCKSSNGLIVGEDLCYFVRPKIYSRNEMQQLADYDNGFLRKNLEKKDCEINGWAITMDGNWVTACFIKLSPMNFKECTGMWWMTTKSIPAQCSYEWKIFKEELTKLDLYKMQLSEQYIELADAFVSSIKKKTSNMDSVKWVEYTEWLIESLELVSIYFEGQDKSLFLYIREQLLQK